MQTITAPELTSWLQDSALENPVLLDVREPWEFAICHISGSQLMPMNTVPDQASNLDSEQTIVCICHHGMRSRQVALYLEQQGFTQLINLTGGVHAWATQVDDKMPTY